MPPHKKIANFDADAKDKSFSTATQTPNQCRSTTLRWRHFRQPTGQPSPFNLTRESSQLRSPTLKSSKFGLPTQNTTRFACSHQKQVIFATRSKTKSISTTRITTKSISPLHWNQVIFDPPHWNRVNLDRHKKQVHFHAHLKNKWVSASIQVKNQFLSPTKKTNQFYPCTEINSSLIPKLRSYQFRPSQKPSQFPCSH